MKTITKVQIATAGAMVFAGLVMLGGALIDNIPLVSHALDVMTLALFLSVGLLCVEGWLAYRLTLRGIARDTRRYLTLPWAIVAFLWLAFMAQLPSEWGLLRRGVLIVTGLALCLAYRYRDGAPTTKEAA